MAKLALIGVILILSLPIYIMKNLLVTGSINKAVELTVHETDLIIVIMAIFAFGVMLIKLDEKLGERRRY